MDNNQDQENSNLQPQPLDKNRKIAAIILVVFAIFIIGMWMVQFKKSISQPFATKSGSETNNTSSGEDNAAALKTKDTDKDGLSDYDELYVYNTSPYLEDSDSDGFTDKQEIDSGNDPNCPAGRVCNSLITGEAESGPATASSTLGENLVSQTPAQTITGSSSLDAVKDLDATTLRQLLLKAGMDKTMLDKISDEQLMQSYSEMLQSQK